MEQMLNEDLEKAEKDLEKAKKDRDRALEEKGSLQAGLRTPTQPPFWVCREVYSWWRSVISLVILGKCHRHNSARRARN